MIKGEGKEKGVGCTYLNLPCHPGAFANSHNAHASVFAIVSCPANNRNLSSATTSLSESFEAGSGLSDARRMCDIMSFLEPEESSAPMERRSSMSPWSILVDTLFVFLT